MAATAAPGDRPGVARHERALPLIIDPRPDRQADDQACNRLRGQLAGCVRTVPSLAGEAVAAGVWFATAPWVEVWCVGGRAGRLPRPATMVSPALGSVCGGLVAVRRCACRGEAAGR
jgi:hypothetical protein